MINTPAAVGPVDCATSSPTSSGNTTKPDQKNDAVWTRPNITLIQTADEELYAPLLQESAVANKLFCQRHGLKYYSFIGVKRGFFPWHACFNRIVMLYEMMREGYNDWVFYVDADAVVVDLNFDVYNFITEKNAMMIAAPGGDTGEIWNINDGVFLLNLGMPSGRKLVALWYDDFMSTSDDRLRLAKEWQDVPSDQPRLHRILQANPMLCAELRLVPRELLNHHRASFVRQILRSNASNLDERRLRLASEVSAVVRGDRIDESSPKILDRVIFGKKTSSSQYGNDYISELERVMTMYVSCDAKHYLEWGTGFTTEIIAQFAEKPSAHTFITIDSNEQYSDEMTRSIAHLPFFRKMSVSIDGQCLSDRDVGLNYSTYPLSLGKKFDFVYIDGRRRLECAFVAALVTHEQSIIVLHDYRRTRYQPVHAFFDVVEDGFQFRVMKRRKPLGESLDTRSGAIIDAMQFS